MHTYEATITNSNYESRTIIITAFGLGQATKKALAKIQLGFEVIENISCIA